MTAGSQGGTTLEKVLAMDEQSMKESDPFAVKRYLEFVADIGKAVPLSTLTVEDVKRFLAVADYHDYELAGKGIQDWLANCRLAAGEPFLKEYPTSMAVYNDMVRYKELVNAAYKRKAEQERAEALHEKRVAALVKIDAPIEDSKEFLTEVEFEFFRKGLLGAADAFLDGGKGCWFYDWRFDPRADSYVGWVGLITQRKEEKERETQAGQKFEEFRKQVSDDLAKLEKELSKIKPPVFSCLPGLVKYQPQTWCTVEPLEPTVLEDWAKPQIFDRVPPVLRSLVTWELAPSTLWQPKASYEVLLGIPCLHWRLTARLQVKVRLVISAKGIIKKFCGYEYPFIPTACSLGCLYLGPTAWETKFGFVTPFALLRVLASGGQEGPGVFVIERHPPSTIFGVSGFGQQVEVRDDFVRFVRDMAKQKSLSVALRELGVVDQQTASLMEAKWDQPLPMEVTKNACGSDSLVVDQLMEMGWTEENARKALASKSFPPGLSAEQQVTMILQGT